MAGQLTIDTLKASANVFATQNAMTGIPKAWVNFNGTNQAISSSFNVSSITKTATLGYTINFTTSMPNANYAFAFGGSNVNNGTGTNWTSFMSYSGSATTSSLAVQGLNWYNGGVNSASDNPAVSIIIYSA